MSERDKNTDSVREIARREFCHRWGKRLVVAVLLCTLAYGSVRGYSTCREQHLRQQLQAFLAHGEDASAVLVARRLLELNENNLPACTAMAELAEKGGRAEAVVWRLKIAHLQPAALEAQIAVVRAALHFGRNELAQRVLENLPESARQGVAYHEAAGATAMAFKRRDDAESHFAAAAQIEPKNPRLAMNLAVMRLASPDPKVAQQALAQVAQLVGEPTLRLECLRALTGAAVTSGDTAKAKSWAEKLRAEKEATFADLMLCFQADEGTENAAGVLEELKAKAATNPASAAELITWLNRGGMSVVALHWSGSLAPEVCEAQPVPLAIAEAYSFEKDWKALRAFVEGKDWGETEALRLAIESHALRRFEGSGGPSIDTQTIWHSALETAKQHPGQVIAIAQLAEGWGYQEEAEEAWWIVASANNNPKAGLSALQRLYKEKQDTRGLLRVAKRALELNPGDLVAANNCASFSLLLGPDSTARRLAAKLHQEHPANRAFAATYAFALQTEGKLTEAVQLMETMKEEELRHPAIAAYYFVMLVESGQLDRARSYLSSAKRATLLPEEQQLVSAATRKLLASDSRPTNEVAQLPNTR